MTLQNLVKIGLLHEHRTSPPEIGRLLASADRNLADAEIQEVSAENRFDAAYKSIMQAALIAIIANGFRPSTSQPGHHQTLVQSLPRTLGLDSSTVVVLDALRKKRNVADYEGDPVSESELAECLVQARALLPRLRAWLRENRPDLLPQ